MTTKKRFDINDYTGKYVMHCDTKEKADIFCDYLAKVGRTWIDNDSYLINTCWDIFKNDTVYYFNNNTHSRIAYAIKHGYTVLEFDDFDWNEKDLIKETLQKVEDEKHKEAHEILQGEKSGSMVDHPAHYQGQKYEVIDIIEDFNLNFSLGSAIKYILRAGKKDDRNQDLEKAIWYLKRELGA